MKKKLYVVRNYEDTKLIYDEIEVVGETETEYITYGDFGNLNPHNRGNFPKDKINKPLAKGFVTTNKRSKELRKQIDRIYNYLNEMHEEYIEEHILGKKVNDEAYESILKKFKGI